ncbi:HET-domain-containing protein [Paraphaeosphaeria sporulosa]|uniref:HET-domain-containing protein n=1 Tax=Paraphaeosphaeria sporulosa TaxID=1460663 RepID=A0A177CFB2_9PLEO|nr:HET-domain-containing protein [Paraphaeosphaeria sporulosa]OAG06026.1 HET-domain-containing protein [Paraphaeosphaeria sporulosa]
MQTLRDMSGYDSNLLSRSFVLLGRISLPRPDNMQRASPSGNAQFAFFLLEYRRRGTKMPLWVDAVCIDQSNTSERTYQVRMMDRIYSEAECVVVW